MNKDELMKDYILDNINYIVSILIEDYKQRDKLLIETDFIFHQDINKQHIELMKWKLAKLISDNLNFKLDECVIFIENNYNKFEELSKNERLF